MPKSKKQAKTITTSRRMWVVKVAGDYSTDYQVFSTKPRLVQLEEKRNTWGSITQYAEKAWRGRNESPYVHEMCEEGFESATGITLDINQVAKLTISVELR
jgi:hypothetical protein